jgi:hypothetical protein
MPASERVPAVSDSLTVTADLALLANGELTV